MLAFLGDNYFLVGAIVAILLMLVAKNESKEDAMDAGDLFALAAVWVVWPLFIAFAIGCFLNGCRVGYQRAMVKRRMSKYQPKIEP